MMKYHVKIKFIAPYLQARFSDSAQKSLRVKAGTKTTLGDDESWKDLLYKDDEGIYIPALQVKGSLINGGKLVKRKPYGSFKDIVKAYFFIEPEKIYIGKTEPDFINESFPARKDGQRVRLLHPAFNSGLEVEFYLIVTNEEVDIKTTRLILEQAGLSNGLGAWRPEHGRYEVIDMK